jgi:hypothetical protein
MRDSPRLRAFAVLLVLGLVSVARAADSPCARTITKSSAKYVQLRAKAIQHCQDARMRGQLPPATDCEANSTAAAMISAARARFASTVAGKCGGSDGACGTGDDPALASYGWTTSQCPSLQTTSCAGTIANCGNIVTCLTCLDDEAVRQTFGLATGAASTSAFGTDSAVNSCQRAIGKATAKFIGTTAKASSKCWEGRIKGQHTAVCPVPGDARTAKLLTRAEQKKVIAICKACGGNDRACDGNGDLAPGAIGFPSSCPAVTVPGGASCGGSVGTLAQLVDCVDCVTAFEDRCADAAAVPGLVSYPPQCGSGGTTTSTTTAGSTTTSTMPPPGGTFLDFTAGMPGGTCGHTYSDVAGTTVLKTLTCGGLNIGGGDSTNPEGPTPDGSTSRYGLTCNGSACAVGATSTMPPANSAGPDCTDTGCNFGTPVPIPNSGNSTCVLNTFSAPASGTLDLSTGAASFNVALNSHVFLTGNAVQSCPRCSASGTPTSPGTGTCDRGANAGGNCTTTNSQGLTRDCPPGGSDGSGDLGTLPVTLSPLITGSATKSDAAGLMCSSMGQGANQVGCFGSRACRSITEVGSPAGPLTTDTPAATTLASVFCIPATRAPIINFAANLPGPGATTLSGIVVLVQTATTVPGTTTTSTTAAPTTTSTAGPTTTTTSTTTSTSTSTIPPAGTVVLDLSTLSGSGACGVSKDGSNVTIRNLACGSLDLGGGGSSVPEGPIPDGATNRFLVTGCSGNVCTLGPSLGAAGGIDCTRAACSFGPPLPISNAGLSTCVVNSFASNAGGTLDTSTGAMSLGVPLSSHVFVTGNGTQPCPRCSAIGAAGSPATGTCDRGARASQSCATTNSNGLSSECLPGGSDGSSDLGSIPVDLTPLITGTASDTSDAAGLFCPGQTAGGGNEGCFGSTACRFFSQTGMPAGPIVQDVSQPVALASAFCLPKTGNVLIDGAASLPGPGAASLAANVVIHQIGPTTSTTSTTVATTTSTTASSSTTTTSSSTTTTTLLPLPPLTIEFSSTAGTGNCGAMRDGTGTVIAPLVCGDLYLGSGASGIAPSALPDGAVNRFALNEGDLGCVLSVLTACPLGPTTAVGPGFDCTTTGCSFGPPVPIPNGALSACSVSTFTAPSTGTVNLVTGATTASVNLGLHLYVTGNAGAPCPRCSVTGTPSAPGTGFCDRGLHMGSTCSTTNSHGLSKDCPPGGADGSVDLGTVVANLTPVTTGTSAKSNPSGLFCPGQISPGCFGHANCRSFSETGVAPNAALSAVTPQPSTLVSTFCVPSSGSVLVDGSAGLPGPAAISLQGTIRGTF